MANTVNGVTSITLDTQRETTGILVPNGRYVHRGQVFRGRVFLDTPSSNFTVDNPTVGTNFPNSTTSGLRIYIVGLEYANTTATSLTISSQIGAGTVVQLSKYELAANGGIIVPIRANYLSPTDEGGKLIFNVSAASIGDPVEILVHYVIASGINLDSAF